MALDKTSKKNFRKFWQQAVLPIKNDRAADKVLLGEVDDFVVRTQANKYLENDYVKHADDNGNMKIWRCRENGWFGAWDEEGWEATDLWDEIRDMRGKKGRVETVKVQVTKNRGTGVIAGSTITIIFDASASRPNETLTLDANGEAEFGVTMGDKYWVRCDGVSGYVTPSTRVYTASMSERVIQFEYRMLGSGVFYIDENGYETDVELWDIASPLPKFVKLTNTTLNPGGIAHDNSIIIDVNFEISAGMAWCVEHKDFTRNANFSSSAAAILDMNGYQNSLNIREEAVALNSAGKSYVDIYNENHVGSEVTLAGYIPAFMYAYNKTVSFMGQNVHGYVLSAGQIQVLKDNLADVNAALFKIGKPSIALNSGYRWSSTEYNAYNAWYLGNGSWIDYFKTYTGICVLAAYDLSDIL